MLCILLSTLLERLRFCPKCSAKESTHDSRETMYGCGILLCIIAQCLITLVVFHFAGASASAFEAFRFAAATPSTRAWAIQSCISFSLANFTTAMCLYFFVLIPQKPRICFVILTRIQRESMTLSYQPGVSDVTISSAVRPFSNFWCTETQNQVTTHGPVRLWFSPVTTPTTSEQIVRHATPTSHSPAIAPNTAPMFCASCTHRLGRRQTTCRSDFVAELAHLRKRLLPRMHQLVQTIASLCQDVSWTRKPLPSRRRRVGWLGNESVEERQTYNHLTRACYRKVNLDDIRDIRHQIVAVVITSS